MAARKLAGLSGRVLCICAAFVALSVLDRSRVESGPAGLDGANRNAPGNNVVGGAAGPADDGNAGAPADEVLCRLIGPNDGELVNGRYVRLYVVSACDRGGSVGVTVNSVQAYFGAYRRSFELPDAPGLCAMQVDLDIEHLQRLLPGVDLSARTTVLRFAAALQDDAGGVAAADRCDWRPRTPWLELLPGGSDPGAVGDNAALADDITWLEADEESPAHVPAIPAVLHPLRGDVYYFLLASPHAIHLRDSPDVADLGRAVTVVASGLLPRSSEQVFGIADISGSADAGDHLVLWTFHPETGWHRSSIYLVP